MAEELDYDPEFPLRTSRLKQASNQYYNIEHYFMPTDDYSQCPRKMQCRNYAIRTILKYTQGAGYKAYIPYIALNYFDRFFSKIPLPTRHEDIETPQQNLRSEEFNILKALVWRACAVTPFCFLNTNYPRFRDLGGFSRRSIHQIIVASLADHGFTKYKPSLIALSSFLAAAHILYGPERLKVAERGGGLLTKPPQNPTPKACSWYNRQEESFTKYKPSLIALSSFLAAARILYGSERLHVTDNEVTPCFPEMISLCIRKNIEIEPACVDGEIREESVVYPWTKKARDAILGIQEKVEGQDRDWDFDVQWLLPSDEQQVVEPTRTRVRSKL
ncbi:putative cyclin-D6-1 [Senna tora]|uniref:Putative cyclin-D6-1 n=1 Tax=Senna tora TaxID=362788 RepID=A0A834TKI7_9FABA|nr:putative cyclin-D6-1 [Senna tora]